MEELFIGTDTVPAMCPEGKGGNSILQAAFSPGMEQVLGFPSHVGLGCGDSLVTLNPSRESLFSITCALVNALMSSCGKCKSALKR